MTETEIRLIRESWAQVAENGAAAVALFYDLLFARAPRLKARFAGTDMPAQHARLAETLGAAVELADNAATLKPILRDLGRRHVGYGVQSTDYDDVGAALLATLERGLGRAWTAPVQAAWVAFYTLVAGEMLAGAEQQAGVAA